MRTQNQWHKMPFIMLIFLLMAFPVGALAATLHAIIVADTHDRSIGDSAKIDLGKMQGLVDDISRYAGLSTAGRSISGNEVSRRNILKAIESLSIRSDDVVIFYYAGHGSHSDTSTKWPSFSLEDGYLPLNSVVRVLKKKKPRFFLALADACNNLRNRFSIIESRGGQSSGSSLTKNYRELFLNYRGHIIASGSEPGQSSWGNGQDGGFFTYGFIKSLNQEIASYKQPNWYTIMKRAEAPIDLPNGMVQNPQTEVKIETVASWMTSPQPDSCYYFYKQGGVLCCRSPRGKTTCDNQAQRESIDECPHYFMKQGGVLCCRRPTGITCE
jgi:hypothetical protein